MTYNYNTITIAGFEPHLQLKYMDLKLNECLGYLFIEKRPKKLLEQTENVLDVREGDTSAAWVTRRGSFPLSREIG